MFALSYSSDFLDKAEVDSLLEQFRDNETISVKSSGSTGKPSESTFTYQTIANSAKATNTFFRFTENTKALLCLSSETIAGKMMLARAVQGDFEIVVSKPSARPLKNIDSPIDFVAMVPLQLQESIQHDLAKLKSIDTILIGGGPISIELKEELKQNDITVYHSFGMTETVSHIALRKVGAETEEAFTALPGVSFTTKNDHLVISAKHLNIKSLLTNDIVELLSDSTFIWKGRKDFVVNSGGYKIQIEEMERTCNEYIDVPFFFWKEPNEKWGEMLVLCLLEKDSVDLSQQELPAWKMPKKIYSFSKFVYSESGKILRKNTFEQTPIFIHESTS